MNALTMFNLTDGTKALIIGAENSKVEAAQRGVKALTELALDNAMTTFRHGDAAKLADVLKHAGFKSAIAKFYSEKCANVCAFVQRKALLSVAGMARGDEKTSAYKDAVAQALRDLSLLKSVAAVMVAVKPPKADEKTGEKTAEKTAASLDSINLVCSSVAPFFTLLAMFAAGIHAANVAQAMVAKKPAKPAKPAKIAA